MLVATWRERVAWWQNPASTAFTGDCPPATAGYPLTPSQRHFDATAVKTLILRPILEGCRLA